MHPRVTCLFFKILGKSFNLIIIYYDQMNWFISFLKFYCQKTVKKPLYNVRVRDTNSFILKDNLQILFVIFSTNLFFISYKYVNQRRPSRVHEKVARHTNMKLRTPKPKDALFQENGWFPPNQNQRRL